MDLAVLPSLHRFAHLLVVALLLSLAPIQAAQADSDDEDHSEREGSGASSFRAPAGDLPSSRNIIVNGRKTAVISNGRLLTPAGIEVNVDAPKPFGMALSPSGDTVATINSGASRFSVTLVKNARSTAPTARRIDINATFMGIAFSPDGSRLYISGGENGNLLVADVAQARIIGSVNLNGPDHPLAAPLDPAADPVNHFKGAFPGNLLVTSEGFLYVVDQAGFQVHVVDTSRIQTGVDAAGAIVEPNNFSAVVNQVKVGRYPFGIGLSADGKRLLVTNVGIFQYQHLRPTAPTGDANIDYPLCYPGTSYPDDMEADKTIRIKKVDPRNLAGLPLRDPDGIRCGYVAADLDYTIPGLGSPNAPEASSVYVLDLTSPAGRC
jgi:hypothetical protein